MASNFILHPDQSRKDLYLQCQTEIAKWMRRSDFIGHITSFIPQRGMDIVATTNNIYAVLESDDSIKTATGEGKHRLAEHISTKKKKLFIMCIWRNLPMSILEDSMSVIGFEDDRLPIAEIDASFAKKLSTYQRQVLISDQHMFPPTFEEGVYNRDISTMAGLPILTHRRLGRGASGTVYSISIDNSCISFQHANVGTAGGIAEDRNWSPNFAMKSIGNMEDAERERVFVEELYKGNVRHPHLLATHTGFRIANIQYLISDQADHDVKHLLNETTRNSYPGVNHKWLKAQFLGLAGALASVHNITATNKAGYIHDIKPANVLVTKKALPLLQLTDWGRGKISSLTNKSHRTNTMGDNAYHPPETDDSEDGYSRPYDIWSMGCLYTDLLVWFTKGKEGYEEFLDLRSAKPDPGDDSFHWKNTVKAAVRRCLHDLKREEDGVWLPVVELIQKMLVIKPTDRPTATSLVEQLQGLQD